MGDGEQDGVSQLCASVLDGGPKAYITEKQTMKPVLHDMNTLIVTVSIFGTFDSVYYILVL